MIENENYPSVGIVILSRYNSTRLPGKALMAIKEKPVLKYIIERLLRVVSADQIIVATSQEDSDDAIAEYVGNINIQCYRGSLTNVAERFYLAGSLKRWDYIIRINGDNVLVDTDVLRTMIELTKDGNYDFVSNVKGRSFPIGMSIEIVKRSFYERFLKTIYSNALYKEHVTLLFYNDETLGTFYFYFNGEMPEAREIRLALDTPEDYQFISKIVNSFELPHWDYNLPEIYTLTKLLKHE